MSIPLDNVEEFFWKLQLRKAAKCELSGSLYELKHNISADTCKYKYLHYSNDIGKNCNSVVNFKFLS